jgi:Flp pilus assembly pilin Flp
MRRVIESLRRLRDNKQGSMPLQYVLVAALGTATTVVITQTVTSKIASKVADKLNAVTSALNKIQF